MTTLQAGLGRSKTPRSAAQKLAIMLNQRGKTLGLNPKILKEGEVDGLVSAPVVSAKALADAKRFPHRTANVAIASAARDDGRTFVADHAAFGLLMGSRDSTRANSEERRQAKLAEIKGASNDDLQTVLGITAKMYSELRGEETLLRAEQLVKNYPNQYSARIVDTSKGKSRDENMAELASEISKWDFAKIRKHTEKDGIPVALDEDKRRRMMALNRGYTAIASELRLRSIEPAVTIEGRPSVEHKNGLAVSRAATAPSRVVRGGSEL